jgi:hypothetical protein
LHLTRYAGMANNRSRSLARQRAGNGHAERRAAQIRIRAETQTGVLLKNQEKAKGATMNGRDKGGKHRRSQSTTSDSPKALKDLGISKDQSSRWRTPSGLLGNPPRDRRPRC